MATSKSSNNYNGIFTPVAGPAAGHLIVDGRASRLQLVKTGHLETDHIELRDLHGILANGKYASALGCIRIGATETYLASGPHSETTYFPHFVAIGESHFSANDKTITAIHFSFENAQCLVSGHRTFQSMHPSPEQARRILKEDHKRREKIARKHKWGDPPFDPEISEHPHLLYFSGKGLVAKVESDVATVMLQNRTTHDMGGSSKGIGISNQIAVTMRFREPTALLSAAKAVRHLRSLFELALGRRQRLLNLQVATTNARKLSDETPLDWHDLHWSHGNDDISGETPATHPIDVLLDPERRPAEFERVVAGWLNTMPAMSESRSRFETAFYRNSYGVDRIVGAANMFDLLPTDRAPKAKDIDPATQDALKKCRTIVKALPLGHARESLLFAFSRVGAASLRDKVVHRAKLLQATSDPSFPELEIPCAQAVICRNHFVHGSAPAFDYANNFHTVAFLSDTLEYVFAMTDLIDLGWSFEDWYNQGSTGSHPFGLYASGYRRHLDNLKDALGGSPRSQAD
jgi:hypothetical protein